jgi:DNA-binding LacI/PurR family transcriptional regulator
MEPKMATCHADPVRELRAVRAHGLTVPGDASMVGLDDLFLASYTAPPPAARRM